MNPLKRLAKTALNPERRQFQGYSGARPDVVRLIQSPPERMLDVGCGAGLTALLVSERFPCTTVVGVEPDSKLAAHARRRMTDVFVGRIDDSRTLDHLRQHAPFDLILCADVLEHIAEPSETLSQLVKLLSNNGRIITSVPNVRHLSTFISLGVFGTWPTRNRGIHDRTHLRFFARRDLLALGQGAGLRLERERRNLRLFEASPWSMIPARLLDFWPLRGFFTFQYLHSWKKVSN